VTVRVTVSAERLFLATNAPTGLVRQDINKLRIKTADALQRNAPRNSPLNEKHRGAGTTVENPPPYADSFRSRMYGNQSGSGFTMRNTAPHAAVVELGRSASSKEQRFSWKRWGGEIKRVSFTGARKGTKFQERTMKRLARQHARG